MSHTVESKSGQISIFRYLAGLFAIFTSWMNSVGSIWVFCLMLLVCADIFGRNVLNAPILGVAEILSYSMVGIVYLQLANTLHMGKFTRAEIVIEMLVGKRPVAGSFLSAIFDLFGVAVFAMLAWISFPVLVNSILEHEIDGTPATLTMVIWPFRLLVFLRRQPR